MKKILKYFSIGTSVQWKWMGNFIEGNVKEIHTDSITKTIKGKLIKRNGSVENPAYLVQSVSGNFALKLQSELQRHVQKKIPKKQPKMFGS